MFVLVKTVYGVAEVMSLSLLGNYNNFYFTIKFEYQMWVWIVWILESDQILNCNL